MKKITLMVAVVAMTGVLLAPVTAQAASAGDTATLSVSVPLAISINFTDDTASFGAVLPGVTSTLLDSLSYDVYSNNATGYSVQVTSVSYPDMAAPNYFDISKDDFATFATINGTGLQTAANWRVTGGVGGNTYLEDVRVNVPSAAIPGTRTAVLTYTATTN